MLYKVSGGALAGTGECHLFEDYLRESRAVGYFFPEPLSKALLAEGSLFNQFYF